MVKILSGMANSVDPDHTAPSGSALFAHAILSEGYLPYYQDERTMDCTSYLVHRYM